MSLRLGSFWNLCALMRFKVVRQVFQFEILHGLRDLNKSFLYFIVNYGHIVNSPAQTVTTRDTRNVFTEKAGIELTVIAHIAFNFTLSFNRGRTKRMCIVCFYRIELNRQNRSGLRVAHRCSFRMCLCARTFSILWYFVN